MELPQCMCFLDRKKCVNLLASLHNKFTCVDRTGDVEWPSPMAPWGLKTGFKQFRKHPSLGYTGTPAKAKLPAAKVAAQSFATPIFGKGKKDKMRYGLKKRVRGGSTPQGEEYDDQHVSTPSETVVLQCTVAYCNPNTSTVLNYAGFVRLKMLCVMLMHLQ